MSNGNHPKNQHYVPRFLLNNFATPATEQVFCYDKREDRVFSPSTRNVASEKAFNDLSDGDPDTSMESPLSALEDKAALIINDNLLHHRTVRHLTRDDRRWLSLFIGVQMVRTRQFRQSVKDTNRQLANRMAEAGFAQSDIQQVAGTGSDDEIKAFALGFLSVAQELAEPINDKVWLLYESDDQFLIGDHPVGLQNTVNRSEVRGTLGLAVPGIEIYLPLSPRYVLCLLCRDTFHELATAANRERARLEKAGVFETLNFVARVRRRIPVPCKRGVVENLNSIQIRWSERFVFRPTSDFDLARSMIAENPAHAHGPRSTVV